MKGLMAYVVGILQRGLMELCPAFPLLKMIVGVESGKKILSKVTSNYFKKSG